MYYTNRNPWHGVIFILWPATSVSASVISLSPRPTSHDPIRSCAWLLRCMSCWGRKTPTLGQMTSGPKNTEGQVEQQSMHMAKESTTTSRTMVIFLHSMRMLGPNCLRSSVQQSMHTDREFTAYHQIPMSVCDSDAFLPDLLNIFYTRCDVQNSLLDALLPAVSGHE